MSSTAAFSGSSQTTTGIPHAQASSTTVPKPSRLDGSTMTRLDFR